MAKTKHTVALKALTRLSLTLLASGKNIVTHEISYYVSSVLLLFVRGGSFIRLLYYTELYDNSNIQIFR